MTARQAISNRAAIYSLLFILATTILIITTGLYEATLMPKDEIVVSILSVSLLLSGYLFCKDHRFIEYKILTGYIIFNIFFMLRISFPIGNDIEMKTYFIHLISIGAFLSIYCTTKLLFSIKNSQIQFNQESLILLLSMSTLIILLISQSWQIYSNTGDILSRPGGFLNPNTTAAIALIFMFIVVKLSSITKKHLTLIALILTTSIILLSQSRSAILVLILFWIYIVFLIGLKKYALTLSLFLAISALLFWISPIDFFELFESAITRFRGDSSSAHRISLLQQGWSSFLDSPIWGNGYRHIESLSKQSSHNEIIETLANFGIFGLIIISVAFYFLYTPSSPIFIIACILPTFLFTHNFFGAYAYQAALGFALAVDREVRFTSLN